MHYVISQTHLGSRPVAATSAPALSFNCSPAVDTLSLSAFSRLLPTGASGSPADDAGKVTRVMQAAGQQQHLLFSKVPLTGVEQQLHMLPHQPWPPGGDESLLS